MRKLLPGPAAEVDLLDVYPAAARTPPAGRPWVMVNMIASADGAVAVGGASRGLGSPADQAVFQAVRACADWILVGAGTVRAERYRLPRPSAAALETRRQAGRSDRPSLAVVSASLDFDPGLPMLADQRPGEARPLILTGPDAPRDRAEHLAGTAEVVRLEPPTAPPAEAARIGSPAAALGELGRRGAKVVLSEGGPTLNAWLADAGMIDELCLSIAPLLAGGPSPRLIHGAALAGPLTLELAHLLEEDGMLFARYLALR